MIKNIEHSQSHFVKENIKKLSKYCVLEKNNVHLRRSIWNRISNWKCRVYNSYNFQNTTLFSWNKSNLTIKKWKLSCKIETKKMLGGVLQVFAKTQWSSVYRRRRVRRDVLQTKIDYFLKEKNPEKESPKTATK